MRYRGTGESSPSERLLDHPRAGGKAFWRTVRAAAAARPWRYGTGAAASWGGPCARSSSPARDHGDRGGNGRSWPTVRKASLAAAPSLSTVDLRPTSQLGRSGNILDKELDNGKGVGHGRGTDLPRLVPITRTSYGRDGARAQDDVLFWPSPSPDRIQHDEGAEKSATGKEAAGPAVTRAQVRLASDNAEATHG